MPHVPAVCDNCGTLFPSGFYIENSTKITFSGNTSGPCPNCGAMGHIPDGTFNFTEDAIQLLRGPQRTVSELQRFSQILREARERNATVEEVRQTIREEAPELTNLADLLPRTRNELYAFIMIILVVIQMLLSTATHLDIDIQDVDIDIDRLINVTFDQQPPSHP